jgi:hypothetical protein
MTLGIEYDPALKVGDIIKVDGQSHKITKKTTTAIQVERYYFWNQWIDWLSEKWTGGSV